MHDLLLTHQGELGPRELVGYAKDLGLDTERFVKGLHSREYAGRVTEDVSSADESGVSGTPTCFVNSRRLYGAYDIDGLTAAVRSGRTRAQLPIKA